jgi:hypothetical protein
MDSLRSLAAFGVLGALAACSSGGGGGSGGSGGTSGTGGAGGRSGAAGQVAGTGATGVAGLGGSAGTGGIGARGPLAGPLRPSKNPNYFQDANGQAVVFAGSHTWNDLQDWGASGTPQAFDFTAYTNFLVAHGQNFTLLWQIELAKFCGLPTLDSNSPDLTSAPLPWQRTGPGTATDGGPKFDLTKFDAAFFDRLRARVSQLDAAGIWVGVYLFTGEFLSVYRCTGDGYPLTGANNINSIDAGGGNGSMTQTSPDAVTAVQDALVDHMIDTLNDLPNVLWIVSEEAAADTLWWQGHMIAHVRAYEASKPHQHPIGLGAIGDDSNLYNSDADWVAPFARQSPSMSCGTGTPRCKVNINDSDHSYFGIWNDSPQTNRQYAWENFVHGNHVIFMDPYTVYYPREGRNHSVSPVNGICSAPDARWDNFRDNLGYIVTYSRKLDLVDAAPDSGLCSTGNCLGKSAATGTEVLVYAPAGGTVTVDLGRATGRTIDFEWFDPATGQVAATGSVAGGDARQSFAPPASIKTDAVLYVVDAAGH